MLDLRVPKQLVDKTAPISMHLSNFRKIPQKTRNRPAGLGTSLWENMKMINKKFKADPKLKEKYQNELDEIEKQQEEKEKLEAKEEKKSE